MDMKQLEISRLMDEYQDHEFLIEEECAVDLKAVKNMVLAKAVPAGKRRIPSLKTVLLAAALTVGYLLSIASGLSMKTY